MAVINVQVHPLSYALKVYNTYSDKFRVVTPVDATDPAIGDVVAMEGTLQKVYK